MKHKTVPAIVLLIASLTSFASTFTISSINVALPAISVDFNIDAVMLGWIATSFLLASCVVMIPSGRLGDIYGRKKIFMIGTIVYGASSLLSVFSFSTWFLIITRVIQGIAIGMTLSTSNSMIISVYSPGKRGKAIGINTAFIYAGLSSGPFLGGILTHYINWRSIFGLNILFCIIIIILTLALVREEWHEAKGEEFDLPGLALYAVSLFSLIYGFSELPSPAGIIFAFTGVLLTTGFIIREKKNRAPMLDVSMFIKNRVFGFSNLAAGINYSATYSTAFFLSLYLQYVKGFTPQTAGLILVIQPVVQSALSPITGKMSDSLDPGRLSSIGMGLITIGLFVISFFSEKTGIVLIMAILAILGTGFALFSSPNTYSIMNSVEKKNYGVASATLGTMRQIGQMLSMGIAMILFSIIIGKSAISSENAFLFLRAMKTGFVIFSILCFLGIFASLARGNAKSR